MKTIIQSFLLVLIFAISWQAFAGRLLDANGNEIRDDSASSSPPNPALYAVQQRNAAVLGNLVSQTPEYQQGYHAARDGMRQRDAYNQMRARQERAAGGSSGSQTLGYNGQADVDRLNDELKRVAADPKKTLGTKDAESRVLRDQQRQIYSNAGIATPIAPEPPPRYNSPSVHTPPPSPPVTYTQNGPFMNGSDGSTMHCAGGFCNGAGKTYTQNGPFMNGPSGTLHCAGGFCN